MPRPFVPQQVPPERPIGSHRPHHSKDRLQLEQLKGHGRIIEVHLAVLDRVDHGRRQGVGIDLEAERLAWGELRDGLIKLELAGPASSPKVLRAIRNLC